MLRIRRVLTLELEPQSWSHITIQTSEWQTTLMSYKESLESPQCTWIRDNKTKGIDQKTQAGSWRVEKGLLWEPGPPQEPWNGASHVTEFTGCLV